MTKDISKLSDEELGYDPKDPDPATITDEEVELRWVRTGARAALFCAVRALHRICQSDKCYAQDLLKARRDLRRLWPHGYKTYIRYSKWSNEKRCDWVRKAVSRALRKNDGPLAMEAFNLAKHCSQALERDAIKAYQKIVKAEHA